MTISEKNHRIILNVFLVLIASLMIFRIPCTIVLLLFSVYNLMNIKKIESIRASWVSVLIIAAPLILHLLFLWNESSLHEGLKATEKYAALLFLPLFIIGNHSRISMEGLLKKYTIAFAIILVVLLARYIIFFPELFDKYVQGKHLWEMGYTFASNFGNHAPALNMHISFAIVVVFYFIVKALSQKNIKSALLFLPVFLVLFFFLLYVNTRLALVNTILGIFIILGSQLRRNQLKSTFLIGVGVSITVGACIAFFVSKNPYMIKKYTKDTFAHMDKIGKLDEIDNARAVAYNSLVLRLSTWKSALELGAQKPIVGHGAADSKNDLYQYYLQTEQYFLYQGKLPVHNQIIDFFLKFGIFGILVFGLYFWNIFQIGNQLKNPVILSFFVIFLISNLSDDFLIRFDGIVYSGFWISIFSAHLRQEKQNPQTPPAS